MATFPYAATFPDGVAYPVIPLGATTVSVSTSAQLTTALANASAGQRIVLASGTYSGAFSITGKSGTSSAGISVEAATTGGAVFAAGSTVTVKDSNFVTLKGLAFPYELSSGNLVQFRGNASKCRVTRCLFGPTSVGTSGANKAPFVYGGDTVEFIRVDHNEFRNKANPGNTILFDGNFTTSQVVKHIRIDHNWLHSIKPEVTNEKEPIRFGVSTMSKTSSYSVIERNRLEDCICEPENISVKCCDVRVTGNTIYRSIGGLVYRHGLRGLISDNYIVDRAQTFGSTISSGGLRFYDANHEVSYNYVDGINPSAGAFQKPLLLDSGDAEGSSTNLSGHWRVVGAKVLNNVIVNCPEGIGIGNNYSMSPSGCQVDQNLVVQAATGTAITQRIAPVSTTIGTNPYFSTTAAAGMTQGSDTIWRKSGYGPRLTFLQAGDVGVSGDVSDSDGTGVLVAGTGSTPPPADGTTAAATLGWGAPLGQSDEFDYSGAPDSSRWAVYNSAGHDGNGLRSPARVTVSNGKMILTGLAGSANTAGLEHRLNQQYGRWEVRCRSFYTSQPTTTGLNGGYHPVLIVWSDDASWPRAGEYDFLENGEPGEQAADGFLHYPSLNGSDSQVELPRTPVNLQEFHNFAFEWSPSGLKGWIDGVSWFSYSGGGNSTRKNLQDMPSGHLTVQLDAFQATGCIASTMELEWVRVYTLTPSGGTAGPQTVTAVGIPSAEAFGVPTVTGAQPAPPANSAPTLLGSAVLGSAGLGYTVGGAVPVAQTVRATGIPSAEVFGTPIVSVADGPLTVASIGIESAEVFGRPTVSAGEAPAPAPGGVLVPSLWAVGADGVSLTPLPAWTKISLSPQRNSPGSLSVEYPAGAPGFSTLADGVSAYPLKALEVRIWIGGSAEGALGGWLVQKSGDDLTPGSSWTFSGHFHEWILTKALVAPQGGLTSQALEFIGASAGLIFRTVLEQAQKRGALPLVTRDFTDEVDSNGQPWAKQVSDIAFPPKTTVAQVADKCVELDMCEYELTAARVWRAFNPGTRGADRTVGADPLMFRHAVNLREHSRRESAKDGGTAVLAAGSEGWYEWAESATAKARLGWRAEVGVDAGQISSQAGVQAVAATQLDILSNGTAEYTSAVEFGPGEPLPLIDYGIGDWAYAWVNSTRRKLRIAQIGLEFAVGQSPKGTVAQNDLITDRVAALYRRLNAISSGDAVVGESVPTSGGLGEDTNPPAAPTGVTVSSTKAYRIPGEATTLAIVDVGWSTVTNNAYPDGATADAGTAATQIALRMSSGQQIGADWLWSGAPTVVKQYAPQLLAEWQTNPLNTSGSASAQTWLTSYAALHATGGAITNDVAHYRVQFQYLGAAAVGNGAPFGFDVSEGIWEEPLGSPTATPSLSFGGVEGGRSIGVRVAAVDTSGNQGPWSVTVAADTAADDQPPPAPSKPIVTPWFETANVTWDGKGSAGEDMLEAAPDFASGGQIEVHVAQGIDFIPDRPVDAQGKVDLSLSSTYTTYFEAAGTTNIADLSIGTTYFFRFVAVDRSGNASEPSETSDPLLPERLVNIQIGPDAIAREQIIDGEIVNAKIADLAVNDAKISNLSVGKLTAGTLTAQVTVSGRFQTPNVNNNQVVFDNAGIRLYQGGTVVGRWQVSDASMLVTGTYLSGLQGERINILPDGSFRMYGAAGIDYASIENDGGVVRMRSRADANNRRSYVDFNPVGTKVWYGALGAERSKLDLGQTYGVVTATVTGVRIWRHIPADDNTAPRFHFVTATPAGDDPAAVVHYQRVDAASSHGVIFGATSDAGMVYDAGFCAIVHNNITPAPINASAFNVVSAAVAKRDIAPAVFEGRRAVDLVRAAPARTFHYRSDFLERPEKPDVWLQRFGGDGVQLPDVQADWSAPQRKPVLRVGPMADDLLTVAPEIVGTGFPRDGGLALNVATIAGVAWAAAADNADDIDALTATVRWLSARLEALDGVVDGVVVGTNSEEPNG